MATGGHCPGKELQQNGDQNGNGNGLGDRPTHWTLLPNNLELNRRSKPAKKLRNKEKSRSSAPAENIAVNQSHGSPRDNTLDGFFKTLMNHPGKPPKQNIKTPVNEQSQVFSFQEPSGSRSVMDNENMPNSKDTYSKKQPDTAILTERLAHLKDCISQLNSVMQHLSQSDEPKLMEQLEIMKGIREDLLEKQALIQNLSLKASKEEISRLEEMRNKLSQDERMNKALLQQILNDTASGFDGERADSARSSFSSKVSDGAKPREVNGQLVHYTDEDKANIQNHLLEKMKASQEKLTALKQQKSVLMSMHKTAEDRLAAYQAELAMNNAEVANCDPAWQHQSPELGGMYTPEGSAVNGDASWDKDFANSQVQWLQQNSQKPTKSSQKRFQDASRNEPPDLSKLSVNLDHIKRRVEMLQQFNDSNVELPPIAVDGMKDEKLGKSIAAVEWQRKKLKNALLELMEKKKVNEELMKELALIKEAATASGSMLDGSNDDEPFAATNIQESQSSHEDNERTMEHLRETINQLRDALNTCVIPDGPSKQSSRNTGAAAAATKRDNIRKEQNEQFPVRRHYEAEGRANEDTDVPGATASAVAVTASAASVTTPSPDPNSWENDFRIQDKKKKLENAKQKLQLMQELVQTIEDARSSGQRIPASYLQALTSLGETEEFDNSNDEEDAETVTDNEDSQEEEDDEDEDDDDDNSSNVVDVKQHDGKASENVNEVSDMRRRSDDNERAEAAERVNVDEAENLQVEEIKSEHENLVKIHEAFVKLQHKFSSSPKQNNEEMRSSGEGGNLQKRKTRAAHPLPPMGVQVPARQQENLLTRQNVETQNRNNSATNVARASATALKKDNINDLSAKLSKPDLCSPVRPTDLLGKYNAVPFPFRKPSLRDEVQNRAPFDAILKQDQSKPQNLSRNRDIRSNSSVNSEPLDGSSSALAPDTTVAATWGGSSTQENFEDENDPTESLEEQESNGGEVGNMIDPVPVATPAASNFYAGDQRFSSYSLDSSAKRRDNRLKKYFKSTQLNQWNTKKNFAYPAFTGQRPAQSLETSHRGLPTSEEAHSQVEDASQASGGSLGGSNVMPMSDKFMQQLQQQLEKLNALCRPVLHEPNPTGIPQVAPLPAARETDRNAHLTCQYPAPNAFLGRTTQQPVADIMQNYTQQLQLQQQLLLSLSQCYHALYMQQLEIQHLQRCLQPGVDAEGGISQTGTQPPATDDFSFRPWFLTPWMNSVMSSVPFPPGQVSPVPGSLILQPTQPSFTFNPSAVPPTAAATAAAATAPCALVTGIQPARAVVHPAAQDNRASSETLNNQMPPRTRANNFVDNFRSYSRQNLLSTSNATKGKDSTTFSVGPQVRQVHPLVPNENSWNHRSRVFIPPHTENSASFTHTSDRSFVRPVANPEYQEVVNRSKKPNLGRQTGTQSLSDSASASMVSCPETDQPFRATTEDIPVVQSLSALPSDTRSSRCIKCMESKPSSSSPPSQPLPDSIQSEVSKLLVQHNYQSKCLEELLHELGNLESDSLQRALFAVRELAHNNQGNISGIVRGHDGDNSQLPQAVPRERGDQHSEEHNRRSASPCGANTSGTEFHSFRNSGDGITQRTSQTQNWPPATIIPLGKFVPKPSTGAVKKRPLREATGSSSGCSWLPSPSSGATAGAEAHVPEEKVVPIAPKEDSLDSLIDRIILDVLPFIQSHLMDTCNASLSSAFTSKIIEALTCHFSLKLTSEFMHNLHQSLVHMLSKYANSRWCECEADLLKNVASTLFRELSLFKSMTLRATLEEVFEHSTSVPKKNPQPDVLPTSSKSFNEKAKQVIPHKEGKDEASAADGNSYFPNSSSQELESHVDELYINMPNEEGAVASQYAGASQGAVGGGYAMAAGAASNWQIQPANAEEDLGYECDPEAETEPEVEAGTEADLAEADQSPGQQGSSSNNIVLPGPNTWHLSQPGAQALPRIAGIVSASSEEAACTESAGEIAGAIGIMPQVSSNAVVAEKEISLDDIPTKLTPLSQEELQKQMSEEQESNALLLEVAEEVSLAGDGECSKDPPTFL